MDVFIRIVDNDQGRGSDLLSKDAPGHKRTLVAFDQDDVVGLAGQVEGKWQTGINRVTDQELTFDGLAVRDLAHIENIVFDDAKLELVLDIGRRSYLQGNDLVYQ